MVVFTTDELYAMCNKKQFFTAGSTSQYEKFFALNSSFEESISGESLSDDEKQNLYISWLSKTLYMCSDEDVYSLADIKEYLKGQLEKIRHKGWLIKINYWWSDNSYDEEPDREYETREEAYKEARALAIEEARISSVEHECDISLRFYEEDACAEVECAGAYAVIDLSYLYDTDAKGQPSVCRYIVTEK